MKFNFDEESGEPQLNFREEPIGPQACDSMKSQLDPKYRVAQMENTIIHFCISEHVNIDMNRMYRYISTRTRPRSSLASA